MVRDLVAGRIASAARDTVRARRDRVAALLGTDSADLTVRAVTRLALSAEAGFAPHPADREAGRPDRACLARAADLARAAHLGR